MKVTSTFKQSRLLNIICVADQCLNESTKAAAPAFTFAGKHEQKVRSIAPSPNTYNTAGLTSRGRKNRIYIIVIVEYCKKL